MQAREAIGQSALAAAQAPADRLLFDGGGEIAAQLGIARPLRPGLAEQTIGAVPRETNRLRQLAPHHRAVRATGPRAPDRLAGRFDGSIAGDATAAALKTIGSMVNQQATVMTFNDALLLMSMVFFGALLLMPLIRKPKQAVADAH